MKIVFTDHLLTRLKQRKISRNIVKEIFNQSLENYWDNLRNRHIVIGEVLYQGKYRKVMEAYDIIEKRIEAVTIHPITETEIKHRLQSGRWNYEKSKRKES